MKRVEYLVAVNLGAGCWLLHEKTTWNAMILIIAGEKPMNRHCFNRGALANRLKEEDIGEY